MRAARIFLSVIVLAMFAHPLHAEITSRDLQRKVVVTEEATLLSQVDAICLYLSSSKVALAPRMPAGQPLEVEATVLEPELMRKRASLQAFMSRLIETFVAVLEERLPIYAPAVAQHFRPETDLLFTINEGPERRPVASLSGGQWRWATEAPQVASAPAVAPAFLPATKARTLPPPVASSAPSKPPAPAAELNEVRASDPGRKGCGCPARR